MTNISFLRHGAFFGPEDTQNTYLNIIGVGATGSWVGLLAAKMGWHNFRVWDADIVESHNCPNQIYGSKHLGLYKVDAFEQVLKDFNPLINVEKHNVFFEGEKHIDLIEDALFIAVDSLSARRDIVSSLNKNFFIDIVAETRMGFTHAEMNIFDPSNQNDIDAYLATLKDDAEVTESACNERIITTLTSIVASNVVHTLCDFYSFNRRNTNFTLPKKTILSLTHQLDTYSI
jgi:molybdopterin/thiamine biosynthesis adenylyltransferase